MPIYEYSCAKGHSFEELQSVADEAITVCPTCGAKSERVLHAPAIHFKGSGFYTTDYGRGNGKSTNRERSESGDSESKESSSEKGGSESKESGSKKGDSGKSSSSKKSDD